MTANRRTRGLSIAVKVIGICAPLVAMLVALGVVAFGTMTSLRDATDRIADVYLDRILISNDAVSQLKDLHRSELEMLAAPARRQLFAQRFADSQDTLEGDLRDLVKRGGDSEAIINFRKVYKTFRQQHEAVMQLLDQGKLDAARELASTQVQATETDLEARLSDIELNNSTNIQNVTKLTRIKADLAYRTLGILLAATLLLSLGVVVALLRVVARVTGPVKTLEHAAATLARGDLTQPLPKVATQDEIGRLARSFDAMVGSVTLLVREIVRTADELQVNSAQLASASSEAGQAASMVATAVDEVALGASKQAEDISLSAERASIIATAARSVASSVQVASRNASLMAEASQEGRSRLNQARLKMEQAESTVVDTTSVVRNLGTMGSNIGQISDLIGTFARKTNFLALKAGIEAARAGQEGRGFGVLATEIRNLALESAQAARQIADVVDTIQIETRRATQAMEQGYEEVLLGSDALLHVGKAFERIVDSIQETDRELKQIAQATRQVSASADDLQQAMDSVAGIGQQTAASVEEVAATAEQQNATAEEIAASAQVLAKVALDLKGLTQQFKVQPEGSPR